MGVYGGGAGGGGGLWCGSEGPLLGVHVWAGGGARSILRVWVCDGVRAVQGVEGM